MLLSAMTSESDLIQGIAGHILAGDPDPAVRFRLLRDVLARSPNGPELISARKERPLAHRRAAVHRRHPGARPARPSHPAGQSHLAGQNLEQVVVIPSGLLAPRFDPALGGLLMFEQVQGNVPQGGEGPSCLKPLHLSAYSSH